MPDDVKNSKNFVIGLVALIFFTIILINRTLLIPVSILFGVDSQTASVVSGMSSAPPTGILPDSTMASVLMICYVFVCGVGAIISVIYGRLYVIAGFFLNKIFNTPKPETIPEWAREIEQSINELWDIVNPPPPPTPTQEELLNQKLVELQAKVDQLSKANLDKIGGV